MVLVNSMKPLLDKSTPNSILFIDKKANIDLKSLLKLLNKLELIIKENTHGSKDLTISLT